MNAMPTTPVKTFGKIWYFGDSWRLSCNPAVMIRVKRWFPRARQGRSAILELRDTPEVARDLEVITFRWPMEMSDMDAHRLSKRANDHREREEVVTRITAGNIPRTTGRMEPARAPYEFQTIAAELALQTRRLLIGDALGLGKSFSGLLTLSDPASLPALVVTLTDLTKQWRRELEISFPILRSHILRNGDVYDPVDRPRLDDGGYTPDVIITSYSKLKKWANHLIDAGIQTVIFDEMQELRRSGSQKYSAAHRIADAASLVVGLTATPVYNYGEEIHNIVSLMDDDILGTLDEFGREWGSGPKGRVSKPRELGQYLRDEGIFLRRTRADVGHELGTEPERIPWTLDLEASEVEHEAIAHGAYALAERIVGTDLTSEERFRMHGDFDWRMREATGVAKAPHVADFVKLLLESERMVLLFGWHHRVYDIWRDRLKDYNPVFFTGRESAPARQRGLAEFIDAGERWKQDGFARPTDPRILIMSVRAGAGIDGIQKACNVAVFGELDWSPGFHNQCIGRLDRTGQEEQVLAYFLTAEYGSDPIVADTLEVKTQQARPIVDPDAAVFESAAGLEDRVRRLAEDVLAQRKRKP